jgi:hypothetical protein
METAKFLIPTQKLSSTAKNQYLHEGATQKGKSPF